mmetsp:Transcript_11831/g.18652  ORF Transcript_11831/g.18652 Transcript_11831/m.18652 type:complete len:941 (-) Transcript_11831:1611-4433(-)
MVVHGLVSSKWTSSDILGFFPVTTRRCFGVTLGFHSRPGKTCRFRSSCSCLESRATWHQLVESVQKVVIRSCRRCKKKTKGPKVQPSYQNKEVDKIRRWLICALLRLGWQPLQCRDCSPRNVCACEEGFRLQVRQAFRFPDDEISFEPWKRHVFELSRADVEFVPWIPLSKHNLQGDGNDLLSKNSPSQPQGSHVASAPIVAYTVTPASSPPGTLSVLCILGTRPEAVKMSPVIRALSDQKWASVKVIFTGQHPDLITPFLQSFNITLDAVVNNLMAPNQQVTALTARMLSPLEEAFQSFNPHLVIVQGDTTSAMAAAVVAFYNRIPIAHVEAGLRTHNLYSPFPEEFNRQLIGMISSYHWAPTDLAKKRLVSEGVPEARVVVTGNTGIDAVMMMQQVRKDNSSYTAEIRRRLSSKGLLELLSLASSSTKLPTVTRVVLLTCHRRENQGSRGEGVFNAVYDLVKLSTEGKLVEQVSGRKIDLHFVYPVHPNSVGETGRRVLGSQRRVHMTGPLDFDELAYILERAVFILTDSGGLQEEGSLYGRPVLVTREHTERPEGVMAGVSEVVGVDRDRIFKTSLGLLTDDSAGGKLAAMSRLVFPFGRGTASQTIVDLLSEHKQLLLSRQTLKPGRMEMLKDETVPDTANWNRPEGRYLLQESPYFGSPPVPNPKLSADDRFKGQGQARNPIAGPRCKDLPFRRCRPGGVTLVLSVFKRPFLLLQLQAAMRQTLRPETIIVYQNEAHVDVGSTLRAFRRENPGVDIKHVQSEANMKFHGRFLLPLSFGTEFACIWDDDVLPTDSWLQWNRDVFFKVGGEGLIGGNGRSIKSVLDASGKVHVGGGMQQGYDGCSRARVEQVDFVGHSWFFPSDYASLFWRYPWLSFQTGEDMQISFFLQLSGIKSYVASTRGKCSEGGDSKLQEVQKKNQGSQGSAKLPEQRGRQN